jgi:ornithine cyclodeaminase/alanine dehydrogenase
MNISPVSCYEWVEQVLKEKKSSILPPKISLHFENGAYFNTMPSVIPSINVEGVKVITRTLDRSPALDSQILLYDYNTQKLIALMDGNWITAMRTGAVAVNTIKNLATENFQRIGLLGLGNTQRATMKTLLHIFNDRPLIVSILTYKNQHLQFKDFLLKVIKTTGADVRIEFVDSIEQLMANNEVVISAVTYAESDFCKASIFPSGVLVVAIHLKGFLGCDLEFDKVFCDDISHVCGFRYFDKWKYVAEVSDVINGRSEGRVSKQERILVYNVGLSLHDVYFASQIYKLAKKDDTKIMLNAPTEKFWV